MLLLLLAAAALTTWQGDAADTAVVLVVVVLNTAVGVAQELRAERAVAALSDLAAPQARVRRDGRDLLVAAAGVVPGDLLLLDAGDVVAADAEVREAHRLETDDSALTGESLAVAKPPGGEVFAGTTVTRGRGAATVTRTGRGSALGRIAAMVSAARPGPTPLQHRLARLGRQLTVAALALSALVVVGGLLRGLALADAALQATSLAVAAVPESLPAVLTLSLALGAHRMARHAAIARELRAVETLGSVTLLATDKTGTLTENRMVADAPGHPRASTRSTGPGYAPEGSVRSTRRARGRTTRGRRRPDAAAAGRRAVQRRESSPTPSWPGAWRPVGDPTEAALVALARTRRPRRATPCARPGRGAPRCRSTATGLDAHQPRGPGDGTRLTVVKGAPDVLLPALVGGSPPAPWRRRGRGPRPRRPRARRVLAVPRRPDAGPEPASLPAGAAPGRRWSP